MRRIRKRQAYGFRGVGSSFRAVIREMQQSRERLDPGDPPRPAEGAEKETPRPRAPRDRQA